MRTSAIVRSLGSAVLVIGIAAGAAGCGNSIEGTYGDPASPHKIELKSGGKAVFTFMNQPMNCSYTVDQKKIALDCKDGNPIALTLSDDGTTLIMPPGSLIPNMKKSS